ncbi:hypothetical protein NK553_14655 [Pseudomonas sp. ZM23]|uniref:Uncharacterized protein n=1 Tax=Pseudomonas triclosanedens TaxID=2961893 RepID=A0ABY6ZVW8_9PSED|nr:DUF6631 family protein [Pseudomonas triclosanedens]MCP8465190.1 hypothetical protein [Pseudomonas triclosanedens]MCP8470870.1 hypothetical protein [Pseudomonas triclosanedens]MCP8476561.1 hypothetical protein [Pseudomonas triclosanedens]WAI49054.1 hypothetical protein OU419_25445 [Pseudomonas triclosanedens]
MQKSPEGQAPDSSLEVLFPDRQLTVGGVDLTVRELTFSEQLRHNHLLAPMADALAAIPPEQLEGPDSINVIFDALALYADSLRELLAISCGQSVAWIDALPPGDGEALILSWWMVNSSFFVRRLWRPRLLAMARGQSEQAGGASSPTSSAPGTVASL